MAEENIYKFYQEQFKVGDQLYSASITPELYSEDDGLDFTGCYHVLLIGSRTGTRYMLLIPGDEDGQFEMEEGEVNTPNDIALLNELSKIISKI